MIQSFIYILSISRYIYEACFSMDANFKADHIQSRNDSNDIRLGGDGESFFVGNEKYSVHLQSGKDDDVVGTPVCTMSSALNIERQDSCVQ
jgi:hypothetical protein